MIERELCRKCWLENKARYYADPAWYPKAWYCFKKYNEENNEYLFIGEKDTPPPGCPKAFEHALSESASYAE
jgi:hypothetical protein